MYSYVIAIRGDYKLSSLVAHVTLALHSKHPAAVPARGITHAAALCGMTKWSLASQLGKVWISVLHD